MLKGIYNPLNPLGKFILFIILITSFLLFSTLLGIVVLAPIYGKGVLAMLSSPDFDDPATVSAMKILQIVNMIGGLLCPAIIYLWLTSKKDEKIHGFAKPASMMTLFLSMAMILLMQPLIGWTNEINTYMQLPEWLSSVENWMKSSEDQAAQLTEAFLATTSSGGLMVNIFMIALLPAFAEEILFRGALAGLFRQWTKNIHIAALLSSVIFAAIHLQFYGFLPRFLLGMVMGYMFLWSGSLWLPIAAHFTNNLLSIIAEYLYRTGRIHTNAQNVGENSPALIILLSAVMVTAIMYFIFKKSTLEANKQQEHVG